LRWDQVDWERRLIRFGSDVRTPGSSEPLRLTDLAYQVLLKWKISKCMATASRYSEPFT